jgi:hypothetical protein
MPILKHLMKFDNFANHFASQEYIIVCYIISIYFYFTADITNIKHILKDLDKDGAGGRVGYSYPRSLHAENLRLLETSLVFSWIGFVLFIIYWVYSTRLITTDKNWVHAKNFTLFLILFAFNIYLSANIAVVSNYVPTDNPGGVSSYTPYQGLSDNAETSNKAMMAAVIIGFIGVGSLCAWHWGHSIWGLRNDAKAAGDI